MTDLDIERITKIEERGKSNTHRIEELEQVTKAIYEQNITIDVYKRQIYIRPL